MRGHHGINSARLHSAACSQPKRSLAPRVTAPVGDMLIDPHALSDSNPYLYFRLILGLENTQGTWGVFFSNYLSLPGSGSWKEMFKLEHREAFNKQFPHILDWYGYV